MPVPLPAEYKNRIGEALRELISPICGEGEIIRENGSSRTYRTVVTSDKFMNEPLIVQYEYDQDNGIESVDVWGAYKL
jgi:hypothetical protein